MRSLTGMERVTRPSRPSRPALAANWAAKAPTNELLVPPRPCACVSQWFSSRYTVAAATRSTCAAIVGNPACLMSWRRAVNSLVALRKARAVSGRSRLARRKSSLMLRKRLRACGSA
ncbi:Uncharacterised protein [Mycobacteroides abscessus subsp. abscessus]|nr:Uncharacterised protein [Mycobacteroides abscessus subsp. abscessus]